MHKHNWLLAIVVLLAVGMMTAGCERMGKADQEPVGGNTETSFYEVYGDPQVEPIIAGQNYNAGEVRVWNDLNNIVIEFYNSGGWTTSEVHIASANTPAGLPRNKPGHLVPGQFPIKSAYNPAVTADTFYIPLGESQPGDPIYIAFHCVVGSPNYGKQTGWGHEWKGYFEYHTQHVYKDVSLPTGCIQVQIRGTYPNGPNSYWGIELAGVPTGYDVWNGNWDGWCAEQNVYMYPNTWYNVNLWSTCNPDLPERCQNDGWDNVNYALNNWATGATWEDAQAAIWYLLGKGSYPTDCEAAAMVDAAVANGDGWRPYVGSWIAVICETAENVQLVFIEVDP